LLQAPVDLELEVMLLLHLDLELLGRLKLGAKIGRIVQFSIFGYAG